MTSEVFNIDCMVGMSDYPDNHFDLAVVDPPYGLNWSGTGFKKKNVQERNLKIVQEWELNSPTQVYFIELSRVSKNQVIWGGNYFGDYLGKYKSPIIWNKKTGNNTFADGELAWTSFNGTLRIFTHQWCGAFKDSERGVISIHPTQKPIALYEWIYMNYLPNGGKVIDTHLGSGSNRIAADKRGNIDFVGYELDKDYFEAQEKRWKEYKSQLKLF